MYLNIFLVAFFVFYVRTKSFHVTATMGFLFHTMSLKLCVTHRLL